MSDTGSGRVVPGEGPVPARLMFLGEAPGATEDRLGRPFMGSSGKFLRATIRSMLPLAPEATYITNVVKVRLPGNATPTAAQIRAALPALVDEIERVNPTVLVTLGATPLSVFDTKAKITRVQGRPRVAALGRWRGVVLPLLHPAATLYNPSLRATFARTLQEGVEKAERMELEPRPADYRLVSGRELAEYLTGTSAFAFDFETTLPVWNDRFCAMRGEPIGFSVSRRPGEARYTTDAVECIRDVLEDPAIRVIVHNAQFEFVMWQKAGIVATNVDDTMVMAFVLGRRQAGLKDLSLSEFGVTQPRWESVQDLAADDPRFVAYGCTDADVTWQLAALFHAELVRTDLLAFYQTVERALPVQLAKLHIDGVDMDRTPLVALRGTLLAAAETNDEELLTLYPSETNWGSTQARARVLYGPLEHTVEADRELRGRLMHDMLCVRKAKLADCLCHGDVRTGAQTLITYRPPGLALPIQHVPGTAGPSTSIAALRALIHKGFDRPILHALEYRASVQQALRQVVSVEGYIQPDGRIHPTIVQAGTSDDFDADSAAAPETGRFSSRNPNVMALLHHGDSDRPYILAWAKQFRRAFVAPAGWVWIKCDAAKEEPNIGWMVSGDEIWKHDLAGAGDVYRVAAGFAFNIDPAVVNIEQRQIGKRMAMAWLNRARAEGIRKSAHWLTDAAALAWCNVMDERYYRLTEWHRDELVPFMYQHGYVKTWFGRRCSLAKVWDGPTLAQQAAGRAKVPAQVDAERECVPLVIQGTAADLLKLAVQHLELDPATARLVLPVHDELNVVAHPDVADAVCFKLQNIFRGLMPWDIEAEISTGPNWADQEEWHVGMAP